MICKSEITAFPASGRRIPNNPEINILVELFRLGFPEPGLSREAAIVAEQKRKDQANLLTATRYESANFLTTSRRPSVYLPERDIHAGSKYLVGSAGHCFFSCVLRGSTNEPTDLFTNVAEQSRHLADTGQWDEAKAVLEEQLSKKDAVEVGDSKQSWRTWQRIGMLISQR